MEKQNANPTVYSTKAGLLDQNLYAFPTEENECEPFTKNEIFDMIRHVNDPEHPLTLEQLHVLSVRLYLQALNN